MDTNTMPIIQIKEGADVKPFNLAAHLDDDEVEEFFNEFLNEGDIQGFLTAVGSFAKSKNISELSRETGLNREGIYKALSNKGNPTINNVAKILAHYNLNFQVRQHHPASQPNH
jgi:probable addiction module antidote protein